MKKSSILLLTFIVMAAFVPHISSASEVKDYSATINVFKQSPQTRSFFANSYGFAVFPAIGKGGLVIGGAYGRGQVYRAGKVTGFAQLLKASIGLQVGGQGFSEIIFFQDKRAYEEFTSGEFGLDAQASAVIITGGAHARIGSTGAAAGQSVGGKIVDSAETNYRKGMAIFVHLKGGAMFEAVIAGQKFNFVPL